MARIVYIHICNSNYHLGQFLHDHGSFVGITGRITPGRILSLFLLLHVRNSGYRLRFSSYLSSPLILMKRQLSFLQLQQVYIYSSFLPYFILFFLCCKVLGLLPICLRCFAIASFFLFSSSMCSINRLALDSPLVVCFILFTIASLGTLYCHAKGKDFKK